MSGMKVLGLHGRMGSGKDFIANRIMREEWLAGQMRTLAVAVADPMKDAIHVLFGISTQDMYSQEGKAKATDWRWEDLGGLRTAYPDRTGPMTVREIMQVFGTETMRGLWGSAFWARRLRKTLTNLKSQNAWQLAIVTDVRYLEEVQVVREFGGEIWKIIPVDMSLTMLASDATAEAHRQHSSEQALDKSLINETVHNSFRDFKATEVLIRQLLTEFMEKP